MIDTIGAAVASFAILVLAFAITIAIIEEIRIAIGEREVRKWREQAARNKAKQRHPSARPITDDEAIVMRREIEEAKRRQSYAADELMP